MKQSELKRLARRFGCGRKVFYTHADGFLLALRLARAERRIDCLVKIVDTDSKLLERQEKLIQRLFEELAPKETK